MNFVKRLRFFIVGVLIGAFVVWAILIRGRSFPAWTPQGRILEALRENPVIINPPARCMMDCNRISEQDMLSVINSAKVLFGESEIRGVEIPEYILEGKAIDGRKLKMKFKSRAEENYLLDIIPFGGATETCNCK